jgi:hypothetical protein
MRLEGRARPDPAKTPAKADNGERENDEGRGAPEHQLTPHPAALDKRID